MTMAYEPLVYPSHYPPTDRWKIFFIGVRWLGPDLSFFKTLKYQQGIRTQDIMDTWGGHERQELARVFGQALSKCLNWGTPYFVPDDKFDVLIGGPTFRMIDAFEVEEIIDILENHIGKTLPSSFWQTSFTKTLGEVIDDILSHDDA